MKYIYYKKRLLSSMIISVGLFVLATDVYAQSDVRATQITVDAVQVETTRAANLDVSVSSRGVEDITESPEESVACTADAKICPDGSAVGRTAPSCEFAACPSVLTDSESDAPDDKSTDAGITDEDEGGGTERIFLKLEGIEGDSEAKVNDAGDLSRPVITSISIDDNCDGGGDCDDTDDTKAVNDEVADKAIDFTVTPDRIEAVRVDRLDPDDDGDGIDTEDNRKSGSVILTSGDGEEVMRSAVTGSEIRDSIEKGVEVRGWDPIKKEITMRPEDVVTEEDLTDYASALVVSDIDVLSFEWDATRVGMVYTQPAKLFGFIGIAMEQNVDVSTDSNEKERVKIQFPWWSFLAKKTVSSDTLKNAVENKLSETENQVTDVQVQKGTFQTISTVLKASHDAALNSIRNVK